jgi:hypothetical protein
MHGVYTARIANFCRGIVYRMDGVRCSGEIVDAFSRFCDHRDGSTLYFVGEQGLVNLEAAQVEWRRMSCVEKRKTGEID